MMKMTAAAAERAERACDSRRESGGQGQGYDAQNVLAKRVRLTTEV